jgi:hypothetical protein
MGLAGGSVDDSEPLDQPYEGPDGLCGCHWDCRHGERGLVQCSGVRSSCMCERDGGRDRPEAACPPGTRAAVGGAGGFNAVQKVLTS